MTAHPRPSSMLKTGYFIPGHRTQWAPWRVVLVLLVVAAFCGAAMLLILMPVIAQ